MNLLWWKKHDLKKGIILVTISWLCFSTFFMISKLIGEQTSIPTMLFFRNVFGILVVTPLVLRKLPKSLEVQNWKIVGFRSAMGLLNLCFILLAVERISLVNTTLLNNSAPFYVPFILWFWLKVPINHKLWPAILAGFIGIALILEPDTTIFHLGSIYALLSGVCLATTLITMRLASKSEKFLNFLFYFFFIGLISTAPFAIAYWKIDSFSTLLGLLAIGLFSFGGQFFLFNGLKHAKASQLAPLSYTTVIFSWIYEWLIWGQSPKLLAIFGMVLIIAAGIWIFHISKSKKEFTDK